MKTIVLIVLLMCSPALGQTAQQIFALDQKIEYEARLRELRLLRMQREVDYWERQNVLSQLRNERAWNDADTQAANRYYYRPTINCFQQRGTSWRWSR
jgi:hypothetical protein